MRKILLLLILFILGIITNSCYVFKDPHKKYSGISSTDIELLIYPSDTITNKSIKLRCQIINNKDIDIAFLPFYQEITTVVGYKVYIWFAHICFKEKNKEKVLLRSFFGDLNLPTAENYILIKPGESEEIDLSIDFSELDDEELPKETKPNVDYGEYEIILWYNDNYKIHPNAINGKVVSNPIKIKYEKE